MDGSTSTSLGTPHSIQRSTVADRIDTVFTFKVSDEETAEERNTSYTVWTKWDGIEDNISTSKDRWNPWSY